MADVEHRPAYLAVIAGLPVAVFKLAEGNFVLGRAPEADFRLDHLEVSRRHCRVKWDGAQCSVEDLGSQWGTRVDNKPVAGPAVIEAGDLLALGGVVLLFEYGEPPADRELERLGAGWLGGNAPVPVVLRGEKVERIELVDHLTIGRDAHSDVVLNAPAVSRQHAVIRRVSDGFRVFDLQSTAGSFVNGRRFDEHDLTIGDRLQIGTFFFHFDGGGLDVVGRVSGGAIHATGVCVRANQRLLLDDVTLDIAPSRFAGIIGPSGAGKSTLLGALNGLRPPGRGVVLVNGIDVTRGGQHRAFGFVPQDDIVHRELTVREALQFAAELRLPGDTPRAEMQKLIMQTLGQLGLGDRAATRIDALSGGQRKRVSVAVELLARPTVLFLDEPTSGLDPATEFKMMELLRDLADTGCTVVCTTHVMENVYLVDQLAVLCGGCLVFDGTPQQAREFFDVPHLSALYDKLDEQPPAAWRAQFVAKKGAESRIAPMAATTKSAPDFRPSAFFILLRRQFAILRSDWRNPAILLGQPVVLAALVSWVSDDAALLLFFAYIATLWFGCSNASQEIVAEMAIYRREHLVGVGRGAYLASKFIFLGAVTSAQSLLFYICLQVGEGGLDGSIAWQGSALLASALVAVGIGALISSLAGTLMQAIVTVPLALIPMILFSGYTVPAHEMKPSVALVSRFTPAFAAQTCMDTSFLWQRKIDHQSLGEHWTSFRNLNRAGSLRTGEIYERPAPGAFALAALAAWIAGTFTASFFALRTREKSA